MWYTYFPCFGILYRETSGNPGLKARANLQASNAAKKSYSAIFFQNTLFKMDSLPRSTEKKNLFPKHTFQNGFFRREAL
jgi:hypothetical protein